MKRTISSPKSTHGNPAPMRLHFSIAIDYEVGNAGAEFVFNIEAARTARQTIVSESLSAGRATTPATFEDPCTHARLLRVTASQGKLPLRYDAVVDIDHGRARSSAVEEHDIADLPPEVLQYIYPSRYCESDKLLPFAAREFGGIPRGYARAKAICDWVNEAIEFRSGSTDGATSAIDVMSGRQGVCRDFAHLMIALCRASNIPARFASGIDYGADPALGPQDFHAYVECYLGGAWQLFDPSDTAIPMGFVRLGTGRDAADCAFATIFGAARMTKMEISIEAVPGRDGVLREPERVRDALSTDDGPPRVKQDIEVAKTPARKPAKAHAAKGSFKPASRARARPATTPSASRRASPLHG